MFKRFLIVSVVLLASLSFTIAGAEPNINEGLWEITSKVSLPGMNMPPMTFTQCITKKESVPQNKQPGQKCQITDVRIDGDTVSWKIACSGQGSEMKGSGKITYKGDSFEGSMTMTMGDRGMQMTTHMSGRRLGKCQ